MRLRSLGSTVHASIIAVALISGAYAQERELKPPQQRLKADVLSNNDVIGLVKTGFGDAIISAKIKQSKCKFDLSQNEMLRLKTAGVSDAIIAEMMQIRPFEPHWPPKACISEGTVRSVPGKHKGDDPTDIRLETIKTFKKNEWPVTTDKTDADLLVEVTRQMGKGRSRKDTKFTLTNRKGDVLHSESTRSVGGAVSNMIRYVNKHREDPVLFE